MLFDLIEQYKGYSVCKKNLLVLSLKVIFWPELTLGGGSAGIYKEYLNAAYKFGPETPLQSPMSGFPQALGF